MAVQTFAITYGNGEVHHVPDLTPNRINRGREALESRIAEANGGVVKVEVLSDGVIVRSLRPGAKGRPIKVSR